MWARVRRELLALLALIWLRAHSAHVALLAFIAGAVLCAVHWALLAFRLLNFLLALLAFSAGAVLCAVHQWALQVLNLHFLTLLCNEGLCLPGRKTKNRQLWTENTRRVVQNKRQICRRICISKKFISKKFIVERTTSRTHKTKNTLVVGDGGRCAAGVCVLI